MHRIQFRPRRLICPRKCKRITPFRNANRTRTQIRVAHDLYIFCNNALWFTSLGIDRKLFVQVRKVEDSRGWRRRIANTRPFRREVVRDIEDGVRAFGIADIHNILDVILYTPTRSSSKTLPTIDTRVFEVNHNIRDGLVIELSETIWEFVRELPTQRDSLRCGSRL